MGKTRELAVARYREFIDAGIGVSYPSGIDSPVEIKANPDEFVDEDIHRIGETTRNDRTGQQSDEPAVDLEAIIVAVENVFGFSREDFCGPTKSSRAVMAKEVFTLAAFEAGAKITEIASAVGLDTSTTSRRCDNARLALATDSKLSYAKQLVDKEYRK